MKTKVIKRDKSIEDYSEEKIEKVVIAAGLNPQKAKNLASDISRWIKENSLLKVSSLEIRDKVIEGLKKDTGYAADLYIWYQKTKSG